MDYQDACFTYIEEIVELEIERADTEILRELHSLFNIKGTELDAVRVGKKQIPKIKLEIALEKFDKRDGCWEEIKKSKPIWIKTEKDVEKKLRPILEDMQLAASICDFVHHHC